MFGVTAALQQASPATPPSSSRLSSIPEDELCDENTCWADSGGEQTRCSQAAA